MEWDWSPGGDFKFHVSVRLDFGTTTKELLEKAA